MNRTMLYAALFTVCCSAVNADDSAQPAAAQTNTTTTTTTVQTTQETPAKDSAAPTPNTAMVIDCQYRIPANMAVEQPLLEKWAKNAAVQSFDFSHTAIDEQLEKLKQCFTDQGWKGYNDALQKSGNISIIKSHALNVSSQVDGEIKINPVKENQWKISVPMQVVYQNDKEKLTQLLSVELLVARKISGDLGIMQIIAAPRPVTGAQPAAAPAQAPAATTE